MRDPGSTAALLVLVHRVQKNVLPKFPHRSFAVVVVHPHLEVLRGANVSMPQSKVQSTSQSGKVSASKGSSKKSTKGKSGTIPEDGEKRVVVRDEFGNDVTPRSLIQSVEKTSIKPPAGNESTDSSSAIDAGAVGMSAMGSEGEGAPNSESGDEASASDAGEVAPAKPAAPPAAAPPAPVAAPTPKPVVINLDEMISFELTETETFFLDPYIPALCVSTDAPEAATVKAANEKYDTLLINRTAMADLYVDTPAQTFNLDKKSKEVQTASIHTSEMGSQADSFDLYDVLVAGQASTGGAEDEAVEVSAQSSGGKGAKRASGAKGVADASAAGSSFVASGAESGIHEGGAEMGAVGEGGEGGEGGEAKGPKEVNLAKFTGLPEVLRVVERMVAQNIYQAKHLQYRAIAPPSGRKATSHATDELVAAGALAPRASFSQLWTFASEELSVGRNVSCLEWNPENKDLLAAAYGEFDFAKYKSSGLILFWSLKNPDSPDKAIHVPCGVTAIAFSHKHPNLLAAGLYDGTVCLFDVRKEPAKRILESGHGPGGKHTDPVWQLTWVSHPDPARGEMLVSISSDGRVTRWDMLKGFECSDLLKLKRVANVTKKPSQGQTSGSGSEGIISRRASGMCIAFSLKDPNIYMAGTEDGPIHKCSCSYNEQHLESFFGHSGPVYKLRWSPFSPNIFLSCSADWSIKLWHQESPSAIYTFFSTTDYVADICWSPHNSTVFASVTGDGRIDVWDISVSTLDPLSSIKTDKKLSSVAFSLASPVLVVGHEGGGVDLYALEGTLAEPTNRTIAEQVAALEKLAVPAAHDEAAEVH